MPKNKKKSTVELWQSCRKDWGNISPVTKVIEDRTKYKRSRDKKINRGEY